MKSLRASAGFFAFVFSVAGTLGQGDLERPRVVVTGLSEERLQGLQQDVPEVALVAAEGEKLLKEVSTAQALIGTCSQDAIRTGKKLRWVQVYSAGVERCMFPELVNSDIVLTNAKIIQGPEIADHAMALLLTLTRNIKQALLYQQKQHWARGQLEPIELNGKTALIIGLGGIGTQVAQRAFASGMRVLAIDPKDIPFTRPVERVAKPDQLHQLLPEADVVFMCAPHTPKTERLLGRKEFSLMKPGAYLVAVSRGKTMDMDALVEALRSGHLKGAGLDVMDPEPLPPGHPLWTLDNVVITPHIAGTSDQIWNRRMELLRDNLKRFVAGQPLRHIVDKSEGY